MSQPAPGFLPAMAGAAAVPEPDSCLQSFELYEAESVSYSPPWITMRRSVERVLLFVSCCWV